MDEPHLHFPSDAAIICRMRTTKSARRYWHAIVREWQLSQPAATSPMQPSPAFVEARIVEDHAPRARGGVIVLELRDGLRVRLEPGFDSAMLRQLVDAIGASARSHCPRWPIWIVPAFDSGSPHSPPTWAARLSAWPNLPATSPGTFLTSPTGDDAPATRFVDANGDSEFEAVQHFLCNRRGDGVAVVGPGAYGDPKDGQSWATSPGAVIARVWHDDSGLPRVYAVTDIDHDGDSDASDLTEFEARYKIGVSTQGPWARQLHSRRCGKARPERE